MPRSNSSGIHHVAHAHSIGVKLAMNGRINSRNGSRLGLRISVDPAFALIAEGSSELPCRTILWIDLAYCERIFRSCVPLVTKADTPSIYVRYSRYVRLVRFNRGHAGGHSRNFKRLKNTVCVMRLFCAARAHRNYRRSCIVTEEVVAITPSKPRVCGGNFPRTALYTSVQKLRFFFCEVSCLPRRRINNS